jgi:hypothetical protein
MSHPKYSIQGRLLTEHSFPSPACSEKTFRSRSTCLIDLGSTLIVLTEGSEGGASPDHEKGLFRLEVDRNAVAFAADETQKKGKEECEEILDRALAPYQECQIHGVKFPFFGPGELTIVKSRPCLCLYSNDVNVPSIYLALFAHTPGPLSVPRHAWEMILTAGDDGELVSPEAPVHMLDLTKICMLPEHYMLDLNEEMNGKRSFKWWLLGKHTMLTVKSPTNLRRRVVQELQAMLLQDSFLDCLDYKDSTRELDVGTWVVSHEVLRGEDAKRHMIYK